MHPLNPIQGNLTYPPLLSFSNPSAEERAHPEINQVPGVQLPVSGFLKDSYTPFECTTNYVDGFIASPEVHTCRCRTSAGHMGPG